MKKAYFIEYGNRFDSKPFGSVIIIADNTSTAAKKIENMSFHIFNIQMLCNSSDVIEI